MVPYRVADDVMTFPQIKGDWTINFPILIGVASIILMYGIEKAENMQTARRVDDHEVRIRAVEGPVIERLIRVEEQGKQTIELLSRIERRQEKGQ